MYTLYLISVWLHIVAAIVWIGGMTFLAMVLAPYARCLEQRHSAIALIRWTGMRFRTVGWACIGLLLLTGLFNLSYRGHGWADLFSDFWKSPFGHTLAAKLLIVGVILLLSVYHDFVLGPHAGRVGMSHPDAPETRRSRRLAAWIGRINLLLALAVVALAVTLVRGWP